MSKVESGSAAPPQPRDWKQKWRKSPEERKYEKQLARDLMETEWETFVINNAPNTYFLNLSSAKGGGYPINGYRLSRRALRSLYCQVRAVLGGNYVCAGKILRGPVEKPKIVRHWRRK